MGMPGESPAAGTPAETGAAAAPAVAAPGTAPRYKPARGGRWEPIHRGLTGIFSLRCAAWE